MAGSCSPPRWSESSARRRPCRRAGARRRLGRPRVRAATCAAARAFVQPPLCWASAGRAYRRPRRPRPETRSSRDGSPTRTPPRRLGSFNPVQSTHIGALGQSKMKASPPLSSKRSTRTANSSPVGRLSDLGTKKSSKVRVAGLVRFRLVHELAVHPAPAATANALAPHRLVSSRHHRRGGVGSDVVAVDVVLAAAHVGDEPRRRAVAGLKPRSSAESAPGILRRGGEPDRVHPHALLGRIHRLCRREDVTARDAAAAPRVERACASAPLPAQARRIVIGGEAARVLAQPGEEVVALRRALRHRAHEVDAAGLQPAADAHLARGVVEHGKLREVQRSSATCAKRSPRWPRRKRPPAGHRESVGKLRRIAPSCAAAPQDELERQQLHADEVVAGRVAAEEAESPGG